MILQHIIERFHETPAREIDLEDAASAVDQLKDSLNRGDVRSAECTGGVWTVNAWVKKGILLAFRIGAVTDQSSGGPGFPFFDKNTMSLKRFPAEPDLRIVPGGTSVRDGSYLGPNVVIMPPAYVNIGAYVDEKTLIDSHVLVGSCAQIGKRVHLSAGTQIGGVLEPVGSMPVVVEDDVFVGGNCGLYEGCIVRKRAVIGAGVILTGSTPVYDLPRQAVYRKSSSQPLEIPEGAVVVPGSRASADPFAVRNGLSLYTPVIVKYRDAKTDAAAALEAGLR